MCWRCFPPLLEDSRMANTLQPQPEVGDIGPMDCSTD
jgi:hypothetical protein